MSYRLRDLFWFVAVVAAFCGGFCWRNAEVNELARAWNNERADNTKLGHYVYILEQDYKQAKVDARHFERQLAALWRQREPLYDELFALRNAADRDPYFHRPLPLIWETRDAPRLPLEAPPTGGIADDPLSRLFEFRSEAADAIHNRSRP